MAFLMSRFARAGVVGLVVVWATATLAMTAAVLDHGPRPAVQTEAGDEDLDEAAEADPTPTIRPSTTTTAPSTTAAPTTVASPDHLLAPSSTDVPTDVPTEVLPSVATAADPVTAQPDFTG